MFLCSHTQNAVPVSDVMGSVRVSQLGERLEWVRAGLVYERCAAATAGERDALCGYCRGDGGCWSCGGGACARARIEL
jgi:hypothetical protein